MDSGLAQSLNAVFKGFDVYKGLTGPQYLETVALAHPQTAHPHVSQQHLAAGVGDEVSVFGSYSQL